MKILTALIALAFTTILSFASAYFFTQADDNESILIQCEQFAMTTQRVILRDQTLIFIPEQVLYAPHSKIPYVGKLMHVHAKNCFYVRVYSK